MPNKLSEEEERKVISKVLIKMRTALEALISDDGPEWITPLEERELEYASKHINQAIMDIRRH